MDSDETNGWICEQISDGTAAVTMTLTGTGDIVRGTSTDSAHNGPFHSTTRTVGESRGAKTSIRVMLNGVDLVAGGLSGGLLQQVHSGTHSINRQ